MKKLWIPMLIVMFILIIILAFHGCFNPTYEDINNDNTGLAKGVEKLEEMGASLREKIFGSDTNS